MTAYNAGRYDEFTTARHGRCGHQRRCAMALRLGLLLALAVSPLRTVIEPTALAQEPGDQIAGIAVDAAEVAEAAQPRPAPAPTWVPSDRRVTKLPRLTAGQLVGAQGVSTSFEALQRILKPGHEVVLARRGTSPLAGAFQSGGLWSARTVRVAEVSAERLVLVRRRLFRTEEIVFPEDAVRRIDIVDPTRQGAVIGAAAGGALGLAAILRSRREARSQTDCNLCPVGYIMGGLLPLIGSGVGAAIDGAITQHIYEHGPQTPRVTLVPLFGRRAIGVSTQVLF